MPEFRSTHTGAVISVREGRVLGPEWEPVDPAPTPAKKAPAKKAPAKKASPGKHRAETTATS